MTLMKRMKLTCTPAPVATALISSQRGAGINGRNRKAKKQAASIIGRAPIVKESLGQIAQKFPAQVLDIITQYLAVSQSHFNRGTSQTDYLQAGFFN